MVGALVELTNNTVPCVVRNVTSEPLSIPKRAELGTLQVSFAEIPSSESGTSQRSATDIPSFVAGRCRSLTEDQQRQVNALLSRYEDMFDGHIGHTELVTHTRYRG